MANGLPSLPASILANVQAAQEDVTVLAGLLFPAPPPTYGIFLGSSEALTNYASVTGFGFQRDAKTVNYPVEQGGFGSNNKVQLPFAPRLEYRVNGGPAVINAFFAQLEKLVQDATNLYTVVNPYYAWENATVTHYDFKQTAKNGYSTLTFSVWLEEVRQAATAQYSSVGTQPSDTATQTPDGQAQQQSGTVQLNAYGTTSNPFPQNALGTTSNPFANL